MTEPTLALQTAIRAALVASPAVTALVPADHIRAGSSRPEDLPAIMMANATTVMQGRASSGQYVASVFLDLHVWALEDGLDRAKAIGAAVARVLMDWPATDGFALDDFKHTRTVWPRDPNPDFGHGVLSVEAVIRWTI